MRRIMLYALFALLAFSATANATVFSFNTDPFAGSTALTTPGRQIVGGELFISFSVATDVFLFDPTVFGVGNLSFANDLVANLPASGVNVIVLQTLDNDGNPVTPFAAGTAANLIAAQLTSSTPGFFIYFNQGLDLPRLVFSTDLNDNTADLKILARMTNLTGQPGALPTFTASNFATTPEPSSLLLMTVPAALWGCCTLLRRRKIHG
ncbi:MAG: hypothetical protein ACLGSA_13850 [Acidobacteriota bacterium]